MTTQDAQEHLFRFLDQHAFQPVLEAREDDYPQDKRDELRHVKQATRRERERYQNYDSAQHLFQMYRDDLTSGAARRVDRELQDLNLPTLADCREEFEREANRVGVQ